MRKYLVDQRKKAGMSQQDVATKLEISRQYYSAIENAERQKDISVSTLCKLAEIFGVPLSDLIAAERQFSEKAS